MSEETQNQTSGGGWKKLFTELLPIEQRTVFGTVVILLTLLLVGFVALNEQKRMHTFTLQYEARSIQRGASIFRTNCASCHGLDGKGLPGIAPALNAPDLFDGTRLKSIAFTGSLQAYVELTIASGRPARSGDWPNPMPTWSNEFGGPLRPDEVRDVAAYVLNWGCQYDPECIDPEEAALLEGGGEAVAPSAPSGEPTELPPMDLDALIASLPEGDVARGEQLFGLEGLACAACHTIDGSPLVGPSMLGVKDRTPEGYASSEHYLAESVWRPDAHMANGFTAPSAMPRNFEERMTIQDLADIIAYLLSLG